MMRGWRCWVSGIRGRKAGFGSVGIVPRLYNRSVLMRYEFGTPDFHDAVRVATRQAFTETLAAGLPVFYLDNDGLNVMELPDGSRFEIRWRPGAPAGENFEVIGPMTARAA
jgi:hypothetical protein